MSASDHHDIVVLGAGPAGEKAATEAAYYGKRVAVIAGARRVRRRVQFYCRFRPVLEWPPDAPGAPAPVAITPAIADVVILTAPGGDLLPQLERAQGTGRARADQVPQRRALDELEHEVRPSEALRSAWWRASLRRERPDPYDSRGRGGRRGGGWGVWRGCWRGCSPWPGWRPR